MEEKEKSFIEGIDYYIEKSHIVLTSFYLEKRKKCCGSTCRNCPYEPSWTRGSTEIRKKK